ncbi:MAG: restriction endonuclease subunit S [Desmonostoc geniculatum HA4340-LM1]|jgi:type I restriction enzyme S subunit|nr:restriction endonuclease subunit S [Desmonostoc geniculatum HA4340-LM1]
MNCPYSDDYKNNKLMKKYPKKTIGELCDIQKGETGIISAIPGEYPLVTTGKERKTSATYQFDTQAVCIPLVSSSGHGKKSLNYIHYQEGKFALGTILAAIIPKNNTDISAAFLHQYLLFYKDIKIVPLMRGAANVSLAVKDIAKIEVPIPPINEQKNFIFLFNKVQKFNHQLIQEFDNQEKYIYQLKQAILQEAIAGKLTAEWRDRHPMQKGNPDTDAAALLAKIKGEKQQLIADGKLKKETRQDSISESSLLIPHTWENPFLGDITKQITDGTHQTPNYVSHGKTFLSAQNVKPFRFIPENHRYITEQAFLDYIKNRAPEKGDLLIARVGAGIGETAVLDQDIEFAFYVSLGLVKVFRELTNSDYLAIVCNSPYGVQYAKGNISSSGTSAGNYNLGRIRSFRIPLPPLAEQKAIAEKVDYLMKIIDQLEQQIKHRKQLAEDLMQTVLCEAFE